MENKKKIKKIILSTIVVLAYVLSFVLSSIAESIYLSADPESGYDLYQTFITVDYIIAFVLSTPFFIIIIMFFRNNKDLLIFAIIAIFASLGFVLYNVLSFTLEPGAGLLKFFAQISYFGAIINLFISFKIILQERYEDFITRAFLLFAVINYGFFSFYTPHIKNFIALFVGPYPHFLRNTFLFYDYTYLLLQLAMVVFQVFIIIYFVDNKEYNRKKLKIEDIN